MKKGYDDGVEEGIQLGIEQGKMDMIISYAINVFNEDISDWMNCLNVEQLNIVINNIFKVKSIEELKQLV